MSFGNRLKKLFGSGKKEEEKISGEIIDKPTEITAEEPLNEKQR